MIEQGEWYWVTDGKYIWPAMADASSVGGWTNNDCWEDFSHEVIAWEHIKRPLQIPPPARAIE